MAVSPLRRCLRSSLGFRYAQCSDGIIKRGADISVRLPLSLTHQRQHAAVFKDLLPFLVVQGVLEFSGGLHGLTCADLFSFDSFGHPDLHDRLSSDANTLRFFI
jgi:hypothetical protein